MDLDLTMYMPKIYERLKAKTRIDETTGCWIWTGFAHLNRPHPGNRYGGTSIPAPELPRKARTMHAHRAMMWVIHGPLTKEQCVCHKCDVPLCINPDHLFIGTMKENIWDSRLKGRHYESRKDYCDRGHPLFGDNLYVYKKNGTRHCKTCQRAKQLARYHANPEKHLAKQKIYRDRAKERRADSARGES